MAHARNNARAQEEELRGLTDGQTQQQQPLPAIVVQYSASDVDSTPLFVAVGAWMTVIFTALFFLMLPHIHGTWDGWAPATCMPDNCFCEKIRPGMLVQPSNTWSNIAFSIVGAIILGCDKVKWRGDLAFQSFAACLGGAGLFIGATSGMYHASMTLIGQWFDNEGMMLMLFPMLLLSCVRLGWVPASWYIALFVGINAIIGVLEWYFAEVRRIMFAVVVACTLVVEAYRYFSRKPDVQIKWLLLSVFTLAFSFGIWNLDLHGIVCWPTSVFQLHACWHILDATSCWFMYVYYASEVPDRRPHPCPSCLSH